MSEYRKEGKQDECFGCPHKRDNSTKVVRLGKWFNKYRKDILAAMILLIVLLGLGTLCGSCVTSCQNANALKQQNELLDKEQSERCKEMIFAPSDKFAYCTNKFHKLEKLDEKVYICRCGE